MIPAVPYSLVNDKAVAGNCSKPAPRYYQTPTNEPMVLLGYVEQQLILAEAVVRGWIQGDDKIYYESAVKASFEFYQKYAVSVADYLTQDAAAEYLRNDKVAYSSSLSTDEKIERIIMQKYLPTFLQGSVWLPYYEALRTGGIPISAVPQELVCLIAGCIRRMNIITMPLMWRLL